MRSRSTSNVFAPLLALPPRVLLNERFSRVFRNPDTACAFLAAPFVRVSFASSERSAKTKLASFRISAGRRVFSRPASGLRRASGAKLRNLAQAYYLRAIT